MNREILFKAKMVDNGEWVEGYYFKTYDERNDSDGYSHYIISFQNDTVEGFCEFNDYCCEIIPETVCQYTGLNDKNSKKIFDKDRLKRMIYTNKVEYEYYTVKWLNDLGLWVFVVDGQEDYSVGQELYKIANECKVIGSIHDKKED